MRGTEKKLDGLRRKLNRRLAPVEFEKEYDWEIADLLGVWWRPEFTKNVYPYIPPHCTQPKEKIEVYLIPLPDTCQLSIPKNYKLLAIPLFELYDNDTRYGQLLASIPQQLGRIQFVCREETSQPKKTSNRNNKNNNSNDIEIPMATVTTLNLQQQ